MKYIRRSALLLSLLLLCGTTCAFGANRANTGIEKVTGIQLTEDRLVVTGVFQKSINGEVSAMLHAADNGFLDSYDGSAYPAVKGTEFTFFFNAASLGLDRDGNGSYFVVMADTGNTALSVENLINVGFRVDFEVKNGVVRTSVNGGSQQGAQDGSQQGSAGGSGQDSAGGPKEGAGGALSEQKPAETTGGAAAAAIKDIEGHWAETSIRALAEKGIAGGYEDGTYRPENTVTRAEFAQLAAKAFGIEGKQGASNFSDVKENDWFYQAVSALYDNGIVSGVEPDRYDPEAAITREQMAVILSGTAKTIKLDLAKKREYIPFADEAELSGYAADAVKSMYCAGIISGFQADGQAAYRFAPADGATRAEVAAIIDQLLNQMEQ